MGAPWQDQPLGSHLLQGPDQQLDLGRAFWPPGGKQAGIVAQRPGEASLLSAGPGNPRDHGSDVVPVQDWLGTVNDAGDDRAGLGEEPRVRGRASHEEEPGTIRARLGRKAPMPGSGPLP